MSLQLPTETAAATAAAQLIGQLNNVVAQAVNAIANGIPARGTLPAVVASDLQTALGTANVTKIQAVQAAIA
jgi:hypothetical protein